MKNVANTRIIFLSTGCDSTRKMTGSYARDLSHSQDGNLFPVPASGTIRITLLWAVAYVTHSVSWNTCLLQWLQLLSYL